MRFLSLSFCYLYILFFLMCASRWWRTNKSSGGELEKVKLMKGFGLLASIMVRNPGLNLAFFPGSLLFERVCFPLLQRNLCILITASAFVRPWLSLFLQYCYSRKLYPLLLRALLQYCRQPQPQRHNLRFQFHDRNSCCELYFWSLGQSQEVSQQFASQSSTNTGLEQVGAKFFYAKHHPSWFRQTRDAV